MKRFWLLGLFALLAFRGFAQDTPSDFSHYLGLQPAFLLEPYDTINALEVNVIPFVYEYRGAGLWAFQVRPIANYRFYKPAPGISQVGAGLFATRYLPGVLSGIDWLTPILAGYSTYTYNQLDLIHTLTIGAEAGVMMIITPTFTLNVNLQPGINYYPTEYSRQFAGAETGFLSHFGVIVHFGYRFGVK